MVWSRGGRGDRSGQRGPMAGPSKSERLHPSAPWAGTTCWHRPSSPWADPSLASGWDAFTFDQCGWIRPRWSQRLFRPVRGGLLLGFWGGEGERASSSGMHGVGGWGQGRHADLRTSSSGSHASLKRPTCQRPSGVTRRLPSRCSLAGRNRFQAPHARRAVRFGGTHHTMSRGGVERRCWLAWCTRRGVTRIGLRV